MSIDAPKPIAAPQIDYSDQTLVDTSYVFIPQPELRALAEAHGGAVADDLDDSLVSDLLSTVKNEGK